MNNNINFLDYINQNKKLFSIIIITFFIIIVFLLVFFSVNNPSPVPDKETDPITGQEIINTETGGEQEGITTVLGKEKISELYETSYKVETCFSVISSFFYNVYPDYRFLSIDPETIEKSDENLSFNLISNTKDIFFVSIKNNEITINSQNKETIFSMEINLPQKSPLLIYTVLPAKLYLDNDIFEISYDKNIVIKFNFCPSETYKNKAIEETKKWINNVGFSSKDYKYKTEDFCF